MKHQCDCNPAGERARIRLEDGRVIATGLLLLPNEHRDGYFWPDDLAGIPAPLRSPPKQEVVAEVLSRHPHEHQLRAWLFHEQSPVGGERIGPHFHFDTTA
jgi:hypothetical protein